MKCTPSDPTLRNSVLYIKKDRSAANLRVGLWWGSDM